MSDIYLIRHAEAELNLVDVVSGRSNDSPITQKGIEQARRLGGFLSERGIDNSSFYSSPARRTINTLLYSLGTVNYEIDLRLQELDQGLWTGIARNKVYSDEVKAEIAKDPWNFKAPKGESQNEVALRVKNALYDIANKGGGNKIVFTHGGSIKYVCAELFGWDKKEVWKVGVDNCSITRLKYNAGRFELIEFNSLK